MTAGQAFSLVLLGALSVYGEFVRPGLVFPCVAGLLMGIAGIYGLAHMQLTSSGLILIGVAAALFLLECFWQLNLVAGLAGTAALSFGALLLVRSPAGISPRLAIIASLLFGGVTIFLCWEAKRARGNKRADLADGLPLD